MGSSNNTIKPNHYHTGEIDLIESWYRTYSWENFVSIMESHIDKYVKRHTMKNGVEDLNKASEFLKRLIAYEEERKN